VELPLLTGVVNRGGIFASAVPPKEQKGGEDVKCTFEGQKRTIHRVNGEWGERKKERSRKHKEGEEKKNGYKTQQGKKNKKTQKLVLPTRKII